MPAIKDIPDTLFEETITRAVKEVFATMLSQPARPLPLDPAQAAVALRLEQPHVVGTVGFIGAIKGLIYLYLDLGFARRCSAGLLGISIPELDELGDEAVNDAVGELTNMTVGTFKNQLSDHGYPCRLTIPSILRGSQFHIEPVSSATRRVYRFEIAGAILTADLLMEPGD